MAAPGGSWAPAILKGVGAPVNPQTVADLSAWQRAEGGSASNNPFNTTQGGFGGSDYNSVGVKNYGSPQAGINATLATLRNGRYGTILNALKAGGNPAAFSSAVGGSPWGTSGKLLSQVLGTTPPSSLNTQPGRVGAPAPQATSNQTNLAKFFLQNSKNILNGGTAQSPLALIQQLAKQAGPPVNNAVAPATVSVGRAAGGALKLFDLPSSIDTRPGIEVNSAIAPQVEQLASRFGVKVNSGYRSAAHNAAVGGAQNSDHLSGNAVDFVGSPAQMRSLYGYAQGRFPYVEPWDQAGGNHVHISFIR